MGLFTTIDRHNDLLNRMADTTHVDLSEALASNRLSGQDLRHAVVACIGCEGGAACPAWLSAHSSGADVPPGYCRNQGLLARLKSETAR